MKRALRIGLLVLGIATVALATPFLYAGLRYGFGSPEFVRIALEVKKFLIDFFSQDNGLNVLRRASINGIVAVGMTFVIITGGIDLSVGGILALASCLCAGLMEVGLPAPVAILAALATGALLGAFNGFIVARGKMQPFIVTMATWTIAAGVAFLYTDRVITSTNQGFSDFGASPWAPTLLFLVTALLAWGVQKYTAFGRYTYSLGGNEEAARLSGINVTSLKVKVYALSGMLAGLAAVVYVARTNSGAPDIWNTGYELDAIAAAVIGGTSLAGGRGSVIGTIFGAIIINALGNALNLAGMGDVAQKIMRGLIILLAVYLQKRD